MIKALRLRLVGEDEQLRATLEKDKLEADKLGTKLSGMKISGDSADLKYKLASLSLSADRLKEKLASPQLKVGGYEKASLQLLKLNAEADRLSRKISVDVNEKGSRGGILKALVSGSALKNLITGGGSSGAESGAAAGGSGLLDVAASPVGWAGIATALSMLPALLGGGATLGVGAAGYLLGNKGLSTIQADKQAVASAQTSVQGSKNPSLSQLRALHVAQQQLNKDTHGWAGEFAKVGEQFQPIVRQVMGFVRSLAGPLAKLFSASIPGVRAFISALQPAIRQALPILTQVIKAMAPDMKILGQAFGDLLVAAVKALKGMSVGFHLSAVIVKGAIDAIGGLLNYLGGLIGGVVRLVDDLIHGKWAAAWKDAKGIASSFVSFVVNTFGKLKGILYNLAIHAMEGLLGGLKSAAGSVLSFIGGLAGNIASTFAGILKIGSPSKVFYEYGQNIADGLINGIKSRQAKVNKEIKTFAQNTKGSYIAGFDITGVTNAAGGAPDAGDVMHSLSLDLSQIKQFAANIRKLVRMGLNHKLLRQIIAAGPLQGGAVAQALADAGEGSIKNINREERQIAGIAGSIGRIAGQDLYDRHVHHSRHHHGHVRHSVDVVFRAEGHDDLVKALVKALRRDIKTNGGGNVQRYLGWSHG